LELLGSAHEFGCHGWQKPLAQDLRRLGAWLFPALPVTPEAVTIVANPTVLAASVTMDGPRVTENSMSGPVHPVVACSSSGTIPPPTVPIIITRYDEMYHYSKTCSGLMMAIVTAPRAKPFAGYVMHSANGSCLACLPGGEL
jgi:hypothetical protein